MIGRGAAVLRLGVVHLRFQRLKQRVFRSIVLECVCAITVAASRSSLDLASRMMKSHRAVISLSFFFVRECSSARLRRRSRSRASFSAICASSACGEERACSFVRVFVRARRAGNGGQRGPRGGEGGIARGVRMRRFKHTRERREKDARPLPPRTLSASACASTSRSSSESAGTASSFLGGAAFFFLGGIAPPKVGRARPSGGKEDCESRNERDPKRVDSFRATPNSFVCANSHVIRGNGRYRENCQFGRVRCRSGAHPARGGVGRATAASRLAVAALV